MALTITSTKEPLRHCMTHKYKYIHRVITIVIYHDDHHKMLSGASLHIVVAIVSGVCVWLTISMSHHNNDTHMCCCCCWIAFIWFGGHSSHRAHKY